MPVIEEAFLQLKHIQQILQHESLSALIRFDATQLW